MLFRQCAAMRLCLFATLTSLLCPSQGAAQTPAPINFIQGSYSVPQTPQATVTVVYSGAQTAGNLNVVVVGWNDATATVTSVTDSKGNPYTRAVGPTVRAGRATQSIYFASNIAAAAANSNIVTVRFNVAANYPDIRILEYSGLDPVSPLVGGVGSSGSSTTTNSGSLTTTVPNVLLVAANVVANSTTGPGGGFINRMITNPDGDIVEDRVVTTAGTYSATAPQSPSGYWVMQMVAFKAAILGPNTAPTISNIAARVTNEDTATGAIGFTVGDAETAAGSLVVSGSSSNTTLVPNGNMVFGGSGANHTVTITPAANQNGTATITVTVSDGQLSTPTSFQLTVNAVNDAPTITSIANQTTTSGAAVGPISFTIGDVETAVSSLVVSGSSSNTTLVPNGNIVFGGSGANHTVTITPAANQNGTATITVTVSDGQLSTPTSFQLTVNAAANTAPTITAIAAQVTNEDTATGVIGFTVGDAETVVGSLTVGGSSSNTTLVPNGNIVLGGTGAARTVTVTPAVNQNGVATITVTVSDGQLSTPTSFQLTVNAVNDAPTITSIANQTTTSGTAVGPIGFTIGDVETAAGSLVVSGSSSNTTLVPNGNIAFGGSGANRTVTITPAAGQSGSANITVTVSDGQLSTPTSFQLTVNAAPSGGLVAAWGFNESSGSTVTDASGNNNTGTFGSGVTRTTAGKYGGALVFNGSSFATVPNAASLNLTTGMTLEAWVFPTVNATNWSTVAMKEQPGGLVYVLYAGSPGNRASVYYNVSTSSSGERGFQGPSALPLNTWSHLAATYNGSTLSLYINGALITSQALTGSIVTSNGALRIGGNGVWGEYFTGRIDEVRIYNRALAQAEIQNDMNTAVGGGVPPSDTIAPTVSITAPLANSTVASTVTVSASASDNIGVVGVQFFLDGTALGSEVIDSPYSTSWNTATSSPGNHSLTARARDAAGNSTMSTAVPVTVESTSTADIGQWSSVSNWPLVAIHAILLPTGNVLAFDGAAQGGAAYIWNSTANTFTSKNAADNIFCAGHCLLPDGRVLVVGGHIANFVGIRDANIFNPSTSSWTQIPSMSYGRWYPTAITLPDGRVLVVAGDDGCVGCWVPNPEIYDPSTNTWVQLSNASNPLPEYPHLFVLSDGRVLATGTFEQPIATQVLDVSTQTWSMVDPVVVDGHSSVMYGPDKFMKSGTSATSDPPYWPAEDATFVLDMTQSQPTWRETAPMAYPRAYHNLTILPDGNVLAVGGGTTTDTFDQAQAVYPAEMWSPVTETWTTMASMSVPRLYHSTALLLPDGRVLVAGGGRFGGGAADDKLNAQIYSPPYLFKGARPSITTAPNLIGYNTNFSISTPSIATIAMVSMIPLGSVTHHFNANQRYLSLPFQVVGNELNVQTPVNANLAQPGYYMLFVVDTNGVPSAGSILRLQ
jgi:hypothetical protein